MTNAALGGDNMIWCIGDWLTPLLWEMLGKSQRTVLHMSMLWMSQLYFSYQVCPAFLSCTKRSRVTSVGYWQRYLRRILLMA